MKRMELLLEEYEAQRRVWPASGRHILAQFDEDTVVVYQAYAPDIGRHAATHGRFGGRFSFTRMSWIKPGFLWMMFRSGWGTKPDQEVILAIGLRRDAFDRILSEAVPSSFDSGLYDTHEAWQAELRRSEVRLQWDPDHSPSGGRLERRAIQLGLRGSVLERYATEWIVAIRDVSDLVAEQRAILGSEGRARLLTPRERVHPVADPEIARRLGLPTDLDGPENRGL
jgi:uncharacterized protein DUF4291